MSLINEVLNELESRGMHAVGDEAIRAIPPRKPSHLGRNITIAISLLLMLSGGAWYLGYKKRSASLPLPVAVPVVAMPASAVAAAQLPASAVQDAEIRQVGSVRGKELVAVAAEEVPVVEKKHKQKKKKREHDGSSGGKSAVAAGDTQEQPLKQVTPQQRIDNAYAKATQAVQEGRFDDARTGYEAVLQLDPLHHDARRALVGVLVRLKHADAAEHVLQDGLKVAPKEVSFTMLLARLQVDRNAVPTALETLQAAMPYAAGRADYQAFMAVLLQRQSRHDEAVGHFQAALKLMPDNGIWLMGLGISLQALQRNDEARDAYRRALASNSLNAQLQAFVQDKLKEL